MAVFMATAAAVQSAAARAGKRGVEFRPLDEKRISKAAQQRDQLGEHAGERADVTEAEVDSLEPIEARGQGMVVGGHFLVVNEEPDAHRRLLESWGVEDALDRELALDRHG